MAIPTVPMHDATGANVGHLPAGQAAGYVTGTGDVPWSAAQLAAHPGVVRIAQSMNEAADKATRPDGIDYENGTFALADIPDLVREMQQDFKAGTRPGQRSPMIYESRVDVTPVVNTLIAAGITSGVGLGVADWNNNAVEATAEVMNASGPFPIVWRQYANGEFYDTGVVSKTWLDNVSRAPAPHAQVPPGQWLNPAEWTWTAVSVIGIGLDGKQHLFNFNPATGVWTLIS
jgi:hypothetical protein